MAVTPSGVEQDRPMFNLDKYPWIIPVLIVFVGIGWLMNAMNLFPGVNWAYTLGIGALGVVILLQGINKYSFGIGSFLLIGSVAAFLRQRELLTIDVQIPILVIVLGVLMLTAYMLRLPNPPEPEQAKSEEPKKQRLPEGGSPHV